MPSPPAADDPEALRRHAACLLALQDAAQQRRRLADELDALHASLSWKLTAPLRRLRRLLQPPPVPRPALATCEPGDADALADPTALLRQRLGLAPSPAVGPARLLVDVTEMAREDLLGGIHRTTRRILAEWLMQPPPGLRVEPVRLCAAGGYVHARGLLARMLGLAPGGAGADVAVVPRAGDVFVGLDLLRDHAAVAAPAVQALRDGGARVAFVLYDLLPLQHPEWFPEGMDARFADWLQLVARTADRVACISRTVAGEAAPALAERVPSPPRLLHFPLGCDLVALTPARRGLPPRHAGRVRWLMVGTVEPRKGHAQALDAFDRLWAEGADVELVVCGRAGWRVDALLSRLSAHPRRGQRLHWLEAADDAELLAAYRGSDVLLAASCGEGYGLPLVEAAAQGLPVLARDLPVFREVAGEGADYFDTEDGDELAAALRGWMHRRATGAVADPSRMHLRDWRGAAAALVAELMRD